MGTKMVFVLFVYLLFFKVQHLGHLTSAPVLGCMLYCCMPHAPVSGYQLSLSFFSEASGTSFVTTESLQEEASCHVGGLLQSLQVMRKHAPSFANMSELGPWFFSVLGLPHLDKECWGCLPLSGHYHTFLLTSWHLPALWLSFIS